MFFFLGRYAANFIHNNQKKNYACGQIFYANFA